MIRGISIVCLPAAPRIFQKARHHPIGNKAAFVNGSVHLV
jgi:hypothetical protein